MTQPEHASGEIRAVAERLDPEPSHALHVASLALQLFDALRHALGLGRRERLILETAACLHDIGWKVAPDGTGHHKASARLIREQPWTHLDRKTIHLASLVARYHRKSPPQPKHRRFAALPAPDRETVQTLAAILRIADGLDRSHLQQVESVSASLTEQQLRIVLRVYRPVPREIATALRKGDLARQVFGRELQFDLESCT